MLIIGPGICIPRITTLSHVMIAPFLSIPFLQQITPLSSFVFAFIFLGITFFATCRESKIIDLLGKVISPLLLLSLAVIISKGLLSASTIVPTSDTPWNLFRMNFIRGYETLDLLGAIFFASIIVTLLKKQEHSKISVHQLAIAGCKAGTIGIFFLCLVYFGMSFLSMFHGHGLHHLDAGQLFRELSFKVLGSYGAAIIGTAVLMACFSTAIALSAVFAEYIRHTIFHNKICYPSSLFITLISCMPLSIFGLQQVLALTGGPIVCVGYPVIIALTLCNIAYKLYGWKPVKVPVLCTFLIALVTYFL
jgi:LIVCS family branched-chain amino acid:cation transporter